MVCWRNNGSTTKRILLVLVFVSLILSLIVVYANAAELKNDTSIVCIDLSDFFYEIILALTIFPPHALCTDAEQADIADFIQEKVNDELDSLPGTIKTRNKICSEPINGRRLNLLADDDVFSDSKTIIERSFLHRLHSPEKQEQRQEKMGTRLLTLRHGLRSFIYVGGGRCRYCFYDNSDKRALAQQRAHEISQHIVNTINGKQNKNKNHHRDLMLLDFPVSLPELPKVGDISLCKAREHSFRIYETKFHAPNRPVSSHHGRRVVLGITKNLNKQYRRRILKRSKSTLEQNRRNLKGAKLDKHVEEYIREYLKAKYANTTDLSDHEKELLKREVHCHLKSYLARSKNRAPKITKNESYGTWNNAKYTHYNDKKNGKTQNLLGLYEADDRFSLQIAVHDANKSLNPRKSQQKEKLPVKGGKFFFSLSAFDLPNRFSTGLLDDNPLYLFINGIKLDFNLLLSQPGVVINETSKGFPQAHGSSIAGITWSLSVQRNGDFGYGSQIDKLYEFIIKAPLIVFAHKNQLDIDFIIKPEAKAKHYALGEFGIMLTAVECEVTDLENSRFDDFKSAVESRIHNKVGLDLAQKYQNKHGHCLYDRIPVVNAHLVEKETWKETNPQCNVVAG